jgi:hypothetical protein
MQKSSYFKYLSFAANSLARTQMFKDVLLLRKDPGNQLGNKAR